MCGIAGSVNFKLSYDIIKGTMLHRGPDEQNAIIADNVDFFHLRLSILDISGGKQPMTLEGRYFIIFNGEIYNHNELRKKFDLKCSTNSDTETLLLLFQKFGEKCLDHLDGMFAFAIYDNVEKKIFLSRDRAGKKPLYIYSKDETIVFASELNCLKGLLPLEIEQKNIYQYMRLGVFYKNLTPYKNVNELEPGTFAFINCQTLEIKKTKWWDIHNFYLQNSSDNLSQAIEKTDQLLIDSVKRRISSSDLEVGCFLSGGIDSGLVTSIASSFTSRLKTMTVSFDGEYDEAPLAKLVAEKYNTDHTEIKISFDQLKNDIEQIISNYGEPFYDSSAIPSFYVSQAAKKRVTVILNGDGADELFAGYRRYVPFNKYDFFKKNFLVNNAGSFLKNILPASNDKKSKYNYLYRLLTFASKKDLDIYLSAGVDIIEDYEKNLLADGVNYLKEMKEGFDRINNAPLSGLKKIMNLDFENNFSSQMLAKIDIATMSHSLEGRSPFLSKELLAYAPTLSDSLKINGVTTKYLLRQLATKYLPESLINQPKRGFEIPLKSWVNGQLSDMIHDYVGAPNAFNRNIINPKFTGQLLNQKIKIPAEKRAKLLWTLFCLEVWYKKVYLS
ncbi:MAG: asparagine synthase (glutamine-hydrolyzing) [Bacteroidota bacterium]